MCSHEISFVLFIYLINIAYSNNTLLFSSETNQNTKSAICVLKLSEKYFVEKKALRGSIVIINIQSYTSTTEALILQTLHSGKKYSIMVKNGFRPHANASHFPEKAKNYMLILENKTDLAIHLDQLRSLPSWNPLAKSVAYYQLKPNEDGERAAIKLINEFRNFKILKSIILIYSSLNDDITAYSWSPYSDTNCAGKCTTVYILDKCKDNNIKQFEPQREMFPYDLKGCPLITYAVISEPYVMPPERKVTNTIWSDAYEFEKGGEINLVKIISVRRAAFEKNFAVVSSRRQAEYMDQKLGKGAPLIYCFPESDNLYKYGVVLLARQWFPMLERFNNIIRSVSENGLIDKWNEELFIHNTRDATNAILPLSIQHLLGAFILIGILYAVSVVIFMGEIILGMLKCRQIADVLMIVPKIRNNVR
ncbi:uncharacterized protein LOC112044642 [Bicyclus anynana]|uniref:Uncharacterized protein LOC112044642 n=1 Tax=Bicyclus anynana TaxID=110368 RepID=A0ABM3LYI0_BICAN|nr:uncharacterized protein LOC112044642 [Bicyclus anynana]